VWPKRKIQLVVSSETPGLDGVRAVLQGIGVEYVEAVSTTEELCDEISERWFEKSRDAVFDEPGPLTDLAFWPDVSEQDFWRRKAGGLGIKQYPIEFLIHNIFNDGRILSISEQTPLIAGRPLLWHILNTAGFEPSILWPADGGIWQCERKQGFCWIIPETWLEGFSLEMWTENGYPIGKKATWVVGEDGIDFYRGQPGLNYLGQTLRWPERVNEQEACKVIGQCIDLGVSWFDIEVALNLVWDNITMTANLRCNVDDIRRNVGASGETISFEPLDDVENWWAG
jgi:hypothetical protein